MSEIQFDEIADVICVAMYGKHLTAVGDDERVRCQRAASLAAIATVGQIQAVMTAEKNRWFQALGDRRG